MNGGENGQGLTLGKPLHKYKKVWIGQKTLQYHIGNDAVGSYAREKKVGFVNINSLIEYCFILKSYTYII